MRLRSLTHLLEELRARDATRKIVVLGSSSLLPFHPELGEPVDTEIALTLGQALGANKEFHLKFGYHADILHPSIAETLPPGWEGRLVAVEGFDNVFALEPLDLAVVKIVVGREKDLALVRGLLELRKISAEDLRKRWSSMPLGEREIFRSGRNLALIVEGIESR